MARQGSAATGSRLGRRLEAGPRSPAARAMASRTGRDPLLTCVGLLVVCGVVLGCVFSGVDSSWPPAASLPFQLVLIVLVLRGFFRSVRAERNRLERIPDSRTRRELFAGWDYDDLVGRAVAYYGDYQGRQVTPVARDERVTYLLVSPPARAPNRPRRTTRRTRPGPTNLLPRGWWRSSIRAGQRHRGVTSL